MTEAKPLYGDYSREIYARGMFADEKPALPIDWAEFELAAREVMDERAVAYVYGGAGSGDTMRENRAAFERWRIVPRVMREFAERDLATTVLGTEMPAPLLLAPIGVQKCVHPDGELASARAAAELGLPLVTSSASSTAMEEIAEANGEGPRWFQFYWPEGEELAESFVKRAEDCGYAAIVLTVDNVMPGWKPLDLQQGYSPFLSGEGIAHYLSDPVFKKALEKAPEEDLQAAIGHWIGVVFKQSLTWEDLGWLRETTSLPIVLKGILHPDDAHEAAERGVDAVVVSNHGGRQIDGAIAALDALPPIVEAVGERISILLDSGVRSGSDVVKALALGADAVLVGRPYLWGLALDGQAGVETVLRSLLAELDLTLALSGYTSIDAVERGALVPAV